MQKKTEELLLFLHHKFSKRTSRNMTSSKVALGFKDFSVRVESKLLLSGLNGFVAAGSITAGECRILQS